MRRLVSELSLKIRGPQFKEPRYGTSSSPDATFLEFPQHQHIRLLTFNIQVGITTGAYRHYFTRSWQHILPSRQRVHNLDRIAVLLRQYDIVALQECDGGSIRSGHTNQVQYLGERSGHPFWYQQLNRNLGRIAQHSNGLLSRYKPLSVEELALPGRLPGRGAILARFGNPEDPLVVVSLHLALGAKGQDEQLAFIRERVAAYRHIVLMGDFNCFADRLLEKSPLKPLDLIALPEAASSFPSWRPEKGLDHILVSRSLRIRNAGVLSFPVSDHLPVAVDILIPQH